MAWLSFVFQLWREMVLQPPSDLSWLQLLLVPGSWRGRASTTWASGTDAFAWRRMILCMAIVLAMFAYMVYGVLMRLFEDSLNLFGKHDSGMVRFKRTNKNKRFRSSPMPMLNRNYENQFAPGTFKSQTIWTNSTAQSLFMCYHRSMHQRRHLPSRQRLRRLARLRWDARCSAECGIARAGSIRKCQASSTESTGHTHTHIYIYMDVCMIMYIYGYGSIPINTILGGWTSIYQLFWCSPGVQGFDTLPYIYIYI